MNAYCHESDPSLSNKIQPSRLGHASEVSPSQELRYPRHINYTHRAFLHCHRYPVEFAGLLPDNLEDARFHGPRAPRPSLLPHLYTQRQTGHESQTFALT